MRSALCAPWGSSLVYRRGYAVLGMIGMCCCYVGAFFGAPISLGAIVVAYDKVFGIASAPAGADSPQ
jgi:preprotein translocase subunit SecF